MKMFVKDALVNPPSKWLWYKGNENYEKGFFKLPFSLRFFPKWGSVIENGVYAYVTPYYV